MRAREFAPKGALSRALGAVEKGCKAQCLSVLRPSHTPKDRAERLATPTNQGDWRCSMPYCDGMS